MVEENVTNVEFNVVTSDKKAGVSIVGNNNLKVGSNKVSIVITAEDGTTNEYTFNVYKMGDNPECNNTCHCEPLVGEAIQDYYNFYFFGLLSRFASRNDMF